MFALDDEPMAIAPEGETGIFLRRILGEEKGNTKQCEEGQEEFHRVIDLRSGDFEAKEAGGIGSGDGDGVFVSGGDSWSGLNGREGIRVGAAFESVVVSRDGVVGEFSGFAEVNG